MNLLQALFLTRLLNLPVSVIIWAPDNRRYLTSFPFQRLAPGEHTVLLQMSDLNEETNRLRLFIDCSLVGEETTEVPIRESVMGKIAMVFCFNTIVVFVHELLKYIMK